MKLFESVSAAMEALQEALRRTGLPWLAAQLQIGAVTTEDEFLRARGQFLVVQKLLALRPPPARTLRQVQASLERVNTLLVIVEGVKNQRGAA